MSAAPRAGAIAWYWVRSWPIIAVNWVTSGRSPGVGVPGQQDPAVPGDDQAQAGQPQVGAVVFHQSANAALEHGATSRFSAASTR
jgi:hypothetical protein